MARLSTLELHISLKDKIQRREPLLGVFVKTADMHVVEVLATTGYDFIILDAEHSPFGIDSLDQCVMAARGSDLPALVRVANSSVSEILQALDIGAAGVLVPHIKSAETAALAVQAAHYMPGGRGFSASHRAGAYGSIPVADYIEASKHATIVIGQVEDVEAVDNIEEIVAVDGVDALFIGPADLTISYGLGDWVAPTVEEAINKVCRSADKAERALGIFQSSMDKVAGYKNKGVNIFAISTDQALLAKAAREVTLQFSSLMKS